MKDFNEFINNDNTPKTEEIERGLPPNTLNLIKSMTKNLEGKSENELFSALISEAENRKRAGTLTNADLDNFYSSIYPMLNNKKREKLKEIIEKIKSL